MDMIDPRLTKRRDAALRRLRHARTGAIAGTAGLTAVIGVFVADTAPGHTAVAHAEATKSSATPNAPLPPLASAAQLGLRATPPPKAVATTPAATTTPATPAPAATTPAPTAVTPAPTAVTPAPAAAAAAAAPAPTPAPVVSGGS